MSYDRRHNTFWQKGKKRPEFDGPRKAISLRLSARSAAFGRQLRYGKRLKPELPLMPIVVFDPIAL
jgi:hypothetical protein